ncbi:MAG TPA: DUF2752 domain-containing protein [Polyangiales bacterium]|nr:DUF2752 domain-containing protein [Polyangiales bacterium]
MRVTLAPAEKSAGVGARGLDGRGGAWRRAAVHAVIEAAQPRESSRGVSRDRAGFLSIAAASAAVLTIASWLVPDPRGFGTHTQLGLPPCTFRELTKLPCPGCGLTTAFAHMVRGELVDALAANPLGAVLFALVALALPASLWAAARDFPLSPTLSRLRLERVALVLAVFGFASWAVRIAVIALA